MGCKDGSKYLQLISHHPLLCLWWHSIFPLNFHWSSESFSRWSLKIYWNWHAKWNVFVIFEWSNNICSFEQILPDVSQDAHRKTTTDPKEFTTVALSLFLTQIMVQSNVETRSMFTLYLLVKNILFTYWVHRSLFPGNQNWQSHREHKWRLPQNASGNKHKHTDVYMMWSSLVNLIS